MKQRLQSANVLSKEDFFFMLFVRTCACKSSNVRILQLPTVYIVYMLMSVCCTHQAQQVEEQVCVFPDQVVRLTAQIHKVMEATGWFVSSVDDVRHVGGEDEWGTVPEQVR